MDRLWLFTVAVSVAFLGVAVAVLGYVFYTWSKTSAAVTSSPQTTTTATTQTTVQSQHAQAPTVAVRRFYVVDIEETPTFVAEIESDSDGVVLRPTCGDARDDTALVKGVNKVVLPLADRRQTLVGGCGQRG